MKYPYLKSCVITVVCLVITACSKTDVAPDYSLARQVSNPASSTAKQDSAGSSIVKIDTSKSKVIIGDTSVMGKTPSNASNTTTASGSTSSSNSKSAATTGTATSGSSSANSSKSATTGSAASGSTSSSNNNSATTGTITSGNTTSGSKTVTPNMANTTPSGNATNTTTTTANGTNPGSSTTNAPASTTTKTITPVAKGPSYKLSAPIKLNGVHDLTINGDSIIGGSVPCIQLLNCSNIHITKCRLLNSTHEGIFIWNCSGITVDSCYISKVSTGVFALDCTKGSIHINSNQLLNMIGPYPKGDFIQFSNVNGLDNEILNNRGENIQGESDPEDGISVYKSNGTPNSPIVIKGNWIRGGGPSTTGSGITLGDQGGSYQVAEDNIIVNSGNIGMQVAGGNYIKIINNSITSLAFPWSHLGLGCGNYSGQPSSNITISYNKVKWISGKLSDQIKGSKSIEKDASYQAGTIAPTGWTTNILNASISLSILPDVIITR